MLIPFVISVLAAATVNGVNIPDPPGVAGGDAAWPSERGDPPDVPVHPWRRYDSTLAVNLGLGSAVGFFGLTYSLAPLSFLETEVGLGVGLTGNIASIMQKFALGGEDSTVRFVAGAGVAYSGGSLNSPDPSVWLNIDAVGLEIRSRAHFMLFLSAGATLGLSGGRMDDEVIDWTDNQCSQQSCMYYQSKVRGYLAPQGRIGIGGWF